MDSPKNTSVQDNASFPASQRLLRWAQIARRVSSRFGWPYLLLLLATPHLLVQAADETSLVLVFLGVPAVICGLALRWWALGYKREEGFVMDGPFRYVRNPVELGAVMIYSGCAVIMGVPWWFNLICMAISVAYLSFASLAYENDKFRIAGSAYLRYRKRVKRWVPSSLPGTNRTNRTYSLRLALTNDKFALVWVLGYFVVFALKRNFFA